MDRLNLGESTGDTETHCRRAVVHGPRWMLGLSLCHRFDRLISQLVDLNLVLLRIAFYYFCISPAYKCLVLGLPLNRFKTTLP